jgi:penicillin-binding protein 2B
VQPHVVEGIYGNDENGALGKILKEIEPKVLNKVVLAAIENLSDFKPRAVVKGLVPFTTL